MKPSIIAFDFETTGLDYWNPDFRVLSCAFAWQDGDGRIKTRYLVGEDDIASQLNFIAVQGIGLVAHNSSFELGVVLYRFPHIQSLQIFDSMRLVQCYDNGGKDVKSTGPLSLEDELAMLTGELHHKSGLGLESAVTRLLPKDLHNHKQPYYAWLRENAGVKKGQEGANLHLLPDDMLEAYNTMDAVLTLMLYNATTEKFAAEGYDWTYDHKLHMAACKRIVEAKARGLLVSRETLKDNRDDVDVECGLIDMKFMEAHLPYVDKIEKRRHDAWLQAPKSDRGKAQRAAKPFPEDLRFNPKSTNQLAELFIGELGMRPKFFTKESKASKKSREANPDRAPFQAKPSMRAAHLPSYGEGGQMLANYKKRLLVLKQQEKLLELSAKDGVFHHDLKACGTKTGRYSGGGGLNIQGLARKEKGLVGTIVSRPGYTFVSMDLSAGEPSACAHYTQDKNYRNLVFDMAGKKPYWDGDLLTLDDVYLAFASLSPLGRDAIKQAWSEGVFETWGDSTAANEEIKSKLKKVRGIHKTIFLGLNYGLGARGLSNNAADQGIHVPIAEARQIHSTYWNALFPGIRSFSERLQVQFKRQGYLYNEVGYRLVPEHERLCLNYLLQSTVSGEIKLFEDYLLELAPYALYCLTWHDETIVEVPDELVEDFRIKSQQATKLLNEHFKWTVEIKTGFVTGKTIYECK